MRPVLWYKIPKACGGGHPVAWEYSELVFFVGQATPPAGWVRDTVHSPFKVRLRRRGRRPKDHFVIRYSFF
jgi:hypothetical protein